MATAAAASEQASYCSRYDLGRLDPFRLCQNTFANNYFDRCTFILAIEKSEGPIQQILPVLIVDLQCPFTLVSNFFALPAQSLGDLIGLEGQSPGSPKLLSHSLALAAMDTRKEKEAAVSRAKV